MYYRTATGDIASVISDIGSGVGSALTTLSSWGKPTPTATPTPGSTTVVQASTGMSILPWLIGGVGVLAIGYLALRK